MGENDVFQLGKRYDFVFKISRDATCRETVAVVEQDIVGRFFVDFFSGAACNRGRRQHFPRASVTSRVYAIGSGVRSRREKRLFVFNPNPAVSVQADNPAFSDVQACMFQQDAQIAFQNTAFDGRHFGKGKRSSLFLSEVFSQQM